MGAIANGAVLGLARALAVAGGVMLAALVLLTCVSILGRELNEVLQGAALRGTALSDWLVDGVGVGAVNGDFELLEAGMAFAIFAFLPWCQLTAGHATVDILAERMTPGAQRWLAALWEVVFAAVLILIAVQLWGGMESKRGSGQTTLRLEFPVWWAYALSMVPAACAALVGAYVAAMRLAEAATGRALLPMAEGEAGEGRGA